MENNTITKHRPILAIIAGILLLLHLIAIVFSFYCSTRGSSDIKIGLIVLAIVATLSFAFAIYNIRSHIRVAFNIILALNIVLIHVDVVALVWDLLRISAENTRERIQQELY